MALGPLMSHLWAPVAYLFYFHIVCFFFWIFLSPAAVAKRVNCFDISCTKFRCTKIFIIFIPRKMAARAADAGGGAFSSKVGRVTSHLNKTNKPWQHCGNIVYLSWQHVALASPGGCWGEAEIYPISGWGDHAMQLVVDGKEIRNTNIRNKINAKTKLACPSWNLRLD